MGRGWYGVDLDGTLAHYELWRGATHIGEPVPKMLELVKDLLAEGAEVRIFTARVYPIPYVLRPDKPIPLMEGPDWEEAYRAACAIRDWCEKHFGFALPITCMKDYQMLRLYDDRCIQVVPNTGELVGVPEYV